MVRKILHKSANLLMKCPRQLFYAVQRKKLRNHTPTIIANNCFGGLVYHNLGLAFRSPTVNLMFSNQDYLTFAENIEGFLRADPQEISDSSRSYPVGRLSFEGKEITVFFVHYKSFAQAKEKWNARKGRVDLSNLYFIFQTNSATAEDIQRFEQLPYRHKLMILRDNPTNSKIVQTHPILAKETYAFGEILRYKSPFSLRRHMDDIDYIGFLNLQD